MGMIGSVGKAALNFAGRNLLGVDFEREKRLAEERRQKQAMIDSLIGRLSPSYQSGPDFKVAMPGSGEQSQTEYTPPVRTQDPLNANSPDLAKLMFGASQFGIKTDGLMEALKAQQPHISTMPDGTAINDKNGVYEGRVFPKLGEGIISQRGPNGELQGASDVPGYAEAIAKITGATEGAKARAQAPYQFPTFEGPDGAKNTVSAATAAALGANGGLISRGQSPSDAAAAKLRSEAQAGAQVDLPRNMDTANATLGLIQQLRDHPGRRLGTGVTGILPGIPGTEQKDFVKLLDQAKGKAFLEAFATLKGGGQITEVEGRKATDAIARLDRTQSEAGFLKALDDLQAIVQTGQARAQHQAGAAPQAPAMGVSRDAIAAELRRRGLLK